MSTRERRLAILETRIRLRCAKCGHVLQCDFCDYGIDVRSASTEALEQLCVTATRERLQKHGISFFRLLGCDLNLLSVEELRMLKSMLDKMSPNGGPHANLRKTP